MNLKQTYHFSGQKEGENVILVIRRHWFDVLQSFFPVFALLILLITSYFYLPLFMPVLQQAVYANIFMFLENLFAMAIFILFFLIWIDYYFDVWIITNRRVVDVEQKGLFSREVSELELEKIQDVTTEVLGVIPTFLNYGNVYIQTAGEKERFVFNNAPNPYRIKDIIMNLQKQEEKEERRDLGKLLKEELQK